MAADRFVRAARTADVGDVVRIQVAAWRAVYGDRVAQPVLAEITGAEAGERFREQWSAAITRPPTSRHRLLIAADVADSADPDGAAAPHRIAAGFCALGPAQDPDLWPATDAEIYALHVDPGLADRGHGERLLNAAADHLVDDGFHTVHVWTGAQGDPLRGLAEAAGWRTDGARREVDAGVLVPMVRLHAAIGG